MKSEREIRKHRDALRACLKKPCGCAGTGHARECIVGMRMMNAVIETLGWALGENDEMDALVERYDAAAKEPA